MSSTTRVLLALIAGLLAGVAIAALDVPALRTAAAVIEPIGTIWVRALQMTLIPLVVSLLITGIVATVNTGATGRLGAAALGVFLALLVGTALVSALVATPLVSQIPIDPETTAMMRASAYPVSRARASFSWARSSPGSAFRSRRSAWSSRPIPSPISSRACST